MPIASITGKGLAAIAFSVALLWGCLIGERIERRQAVRERILVMREVQKLRRRVAPLPISAPAPLSPARPHVTAG